MIEIRIENFAIWSNDLLCFFSSPKIQILFVERDLLGSDLTTDGESGAAKDENKNF